MRWLTYEGRGDVDKNPIWYSDLERDKSWGEWRSRNIYDLLIFLNRTVLLLTKAGVNKLKISKLPDVDFGNFENFLVGWIQPASLKLSVDFHKYCLLAFLNFLCVACLIRLNGKKIEANFFRHFGFCSMVKLCSITVCHSNLFLSNEKKNKTGGSVKVEF